MSAGAGYSQLDRSLHSLAFRGLEVQKVLADLEDTIYARVAEIALDRPVFITSLPRAGTTLLLQLVSRLPDFRCHTYRNMPFLLCPLFWDRLSRSFRRKEALRERAHGDGVTVGYDSPEAFEEVIWKAFWPDHYLEDRIIPWAADEVDPDFEAFFPQHLRKVVALGSDRSGGPASRYVSKNNANIARIAFLVRMFPDARFLVPFRDPIQQAGSLLRQHLRFLEIHAQDDFNRRYMEWLGHFDFGSILRPLDLGGWTSRREDHDPRHMSFWLDYWCAAFESLLKGLAEEQGAARVTVVDYDQGCDRAEQMLTRLARALELEDERPLLAEARRVRRPSDRYDPPEDVKPALLERARTIHDRLRAAAA